MNDFIIINDSSEDELLEQSIDMEVEDIIEEITLYRVALVSNEYVSSVISRLKRDGLEASVSRVACDSSYVFIPNYSEELPF